MSTSSEGPNWTRMTHAELMTDYRTRFGQPAREHVVTPETRPQDHEAAVYDADTAHPKAPEAGPEAHAVDAPLRDVDVVDKPLLQKGAGDEILSKVQGA